MHWLSTAINTYLEHPLHANGYQWWSGAGSDLGEASILVALIGVAKHRNCQQRGCWRLGHAHPDHGRPVCRRHYHHDVTPPDRRCEMTSEPKAR